MIAERHIQQYNQLKGLRVPTSKLKAFHAALKKDIEAKRVTTNMPYGTRLVDIEKRVAKVLATAKNELYLNIDLQPVKLVDNKPKHKPIKQPKGVVSKKPLIKPAVKKEVPQKFVATKRLEGIVNSDQIKKMSFRQVPIDGIYKSIFNKLYNDSQLMFWGVPGSGKTVGLLLFADYLAERMNLKVLYIANEELNRSTLTEKLNQFEISSKIDFARTFKDLEKSNKTLADYDVIFLDSVQSLRIDLDKYIALVEANPGKMFVLIVQTTKDGDFKGGKEWEHEVDIAGEFINRQIVLIKNRYDPDLEQKREALHMEYAVKERKKKQLISRRVKEQLTNTEGDE